MKSKKRLLCMALLVMLVLSMASTASAYYYHGHCINNFRTTGTIDLYSYVRDNNSRCYFCPTATEYNTGYNSTAWKAGESTNFSSHQMSSGDDHTHGYRGESGQGYLRFYNTDQPGQYIYLYGNMS